MPVRAGKQRPVTSGGVIDGHAAWRWPWLRRGAPWLAAAALAGCGLDTFEVEVEGGTTIPGQPFGSALPLTTLGPLAGLTAIDFTSTREFEDGGYDADDLDSVKLKAITLSAVDPQDANLDFLQAIYFHGEAEGQDTALLASGDPLPQDGSRSVELSVADVELKPYVAGSSLSITTEATGLPPRFDTQLHVKAVFEVNVNAGIF